MIRAGRRTISIFETIKLPSVIGHSRSRAILSRLNRTWIGVFVSTPRPKRDPGSRASRPEQPDLYAIRDQWNRGKLSAEIGAWSVANYRQIITDINGLRRRIMRRRVIERRAVGTTARCGSMHRQLIVSCTKWHELVYRHEETHRAYVQWFSHQDGQLVNSVNSIRVHISDRS